MHNAHYEMFTTWIRGVATGGKVGSIAKLVAQTSGLEYHPIGEFWAVGII